MVTDEIGWYVVGELEGQQAELEQRIEEEQRFAGIIDKVRSETAVDYMHQWHQQLGALARRVREMIGQKAN